MNDPYYNYRDETLLKLISSGDKKAFTCLFHRYWADLYRSAFLMLQDRSISMDVVQEVFVWFWENREKWNVSNIPAYLKAAVKYKVANYIRKDKLRSTAFERWKAQANNRVEVVSEPIELRELKQVIQDFTGKLPPRCQEIFRLSRFEHLSNKEIADQLNISEKTVENQITIALRRLRKHLGKLAFWMIFFL